ncbi:MAG: peptidylprolyl isomerase [Euryarchaeota archaeon]|nr:peptidylprolyl isomerase [Euryarchaeota archaeon]
MVLEKGDFVKINYTGRIKDGEVFDTTIEEVAKQHGIYDPRMRFKAQAIVIGAGHVIPGLDEALVGMEVGEKRVVEIPPEKGFGLRDPSKVKVVPMREFRKQGLRPYPGMRIEVEGKVGRVQSVSGGRVLVDFNSELAGKTLVYEVNVEEKINKLEEKIRLLLERHFPYADPNEHEIRCEDGRAIITLSDAVKLRSDAFIAKHLVAREVFEYLEGIEEVEFQEVYRKPEEKKEEAGEEEKKQKGRAKRKRGRKK